MYREDYLLAKVEADIGKDTWFGTAVPTEPVLSVETRNRGKFRRWREQRKLRQEYERQVMEYNRKKQELEKEVCQMATEILTAVEEAGAKGEICCVYEEGLGFLKEEEA